MDKNKQEQAEQSVTADKKEWSAPKLQVLNAKGAEGGAAGAPYEATYYHT